MQSPHKEDYIQTIMRLDERSQQALVVIVQNAIDQRLEEVGEESQKNRVREQMEMLANQN